MAEVITKITRTLTLNEGECRIIQMLEDKESFSNSEYKFTSWKTDTEIGNEFDNIVEVEHRQTNLVLGTFFESQAKAGKKIKLTVPE